MSGLVFRFAQRDERQALEDLQRRSSLVYAAYRDVLLANPGAIHLPLSQIEQQQVRVAEQDGLVSGFTVVLPGEGESCDLDGLFVEPDRWKRGIGRALMGDAFAQARSGGAKVMDVLANPDAEGFYARLGFVRSGTVQTTYGIASKMHRKLAGESVS